jgi:hypothetical protein
MTRQIHVRAPEHQRLHQEQMSRTTATARVGTEAVNRGAFNLRTPRQAFRLTLDENLRGVADPGEIVAIPSEALGRHLGVGQIIYAEVKADGDFVTIERE